MEFFESIQTFYGFLALALGLGVVFLNGFTDAPNSIATVVSTGSLSMNKACTLCAFCNLFGLLVSYFIGNKVAKTVGQIASLGENREKALFVVFLCVVTFTILAWAFSIPSSESHALISSLAGVGLATTREINLSLFFYIILCMVASCVASFLLSAMTTKILKNAYLPYSKLQALGCGISSFTHGAQDGQKLFGILLLVAPKNANYSHITPFLLVCSMLFLGSLMGGGKITKLMGEKIARLNPKSGFISDASTSVCTLVCSLIGVPVSTSNIKACSVASSALCSGEKASTKTLVKIAYIALATFPFCILLSFALAKLIF